MNFRRFLLTIATTSVFMIGAPSTGIAAAGNVGGGGGNIGGSAFDPNEAYQEGLELLKQGKCKKASRKFKAVIKATKRNAEVNYLNGSALRCEGEHKSAVKYFKRAIKYDKTLYVAYEMLGRTYLDLDKGKKAEKQLDRLADLLEDCGDECPPKLSAAHDGLAAEIQGAQSDSNDARLPESDGRQHALLFESVAEPRTAYLQAVELINAGAFDAAIEELRSLLQAIGPQPDVLNYLGYANRKLGRFDDSLAYYEQALDLDPMHRGANEYLGELYVELGELDLARERLAKLDRICPFGCAEYEDLRRRIELRTVASH